ncbi:hypothetical protein EGJ05_04435 [Stutzerimonas xanthomarina]|nr:hypothetical protein EGJ05_04435 [Stutzerimonas xanthomarina]
MLNHTLDEITKAKIEKEKLEYASKRKAEELKAEKRRFECMMAKIEDGDCKLKQINLDIFNGEKILRNTQLATKKQKIVSQTLVKRINHLTAEQTTLLNSIANENKTLSKLREEVKAKEIELSKQLEKQENLEKTNKSLLKEIQENADKKQKIENYDLKLNLLAFNIQERRKIEDSLKEFDKANYEILKEMNPKERIEFLAGQQERFKRESIDKVVNTNLSTSQKVGLFFNDVKRRIIKPGS